MMRLGKKKNSPSPLRKLQWWLLHNGPRKHITVETRNGLISFDSADNAVGKHVFFKREYDVDKASELTHFMEEEGYIDVENPGLVLNVGANIGLLSTALKLYTLFNNVVAFEPVPSNFELLMKNVSQNNLASDVDCVNLALSSSDGVVDMELSEENYGDHRVRRTTSDGEFGESEWKTVQVEMRRLDTFMNEYYKDSKVGLVWMDIQGHEGDFFIGARDIIVRDRVPTVTEFWPYGINRSGMTQDQYIKLVSSMYTHYYDYIDMQPRIIEEIDRLFDSYSEPDVGTDIILVNEDWVSSGA